MSNRNLANLLQTMTPAVRQSPLRALFLAVAVALCGLMTVADLPSPAPVHAQEQQVTPTKESTGAAPPERPTDLQASAGHDSVTLTWTASTDDTVTHYAVLRRDRNADASGVFHVIDSNAGPGLGYTDDAVSPEGSYVYRVKAVSPTGVSQWSSYARADTPAAPTPTPEPTPEPDPEALAPSGLSAKVVSGDDGVIEGVALAWDAPAEHAASVTGYEILRAVGDGEMATLVSDTGSAGATYTDDTATEAGESYAYRVKALRGQEASQPSDRAEAIIPKATPVEPEPPIADRQSATAIWSATLTPGELGGGYFGCSNESSLTCSSSNRLTDDSFTHDSTTYSISDFFLHSGTLELNVGANPSATTIADLTLNVGGSPFPLSNADVNGSRIEWTNTGLSWTAGTDVTVSLTEEAGAVAPTVSSVVVTSDPGADETYAPGDTIQVMVTFDQAVTVNTSGGTPRIQLRVGGGDPEHLKWADYTSGTGNEALVFAYTVQAGDEDTNGIYIAADELELNGGTIQSAEGTDAELAYTQPGTQSGHKVDGVGPTPVLAGTSDDGASVIILFSEPLHMTTAPASAFSLAVDTGTAPAVTSATATGDRVTLGLASALTSDQVVAVTYIDTTSGDDTVAVQDALGNDAANFTTGEGEFPAVVNAVGTGCSIADGCYVVPANWGLLPGGLGAGTEFRLIFISSTTRNAQSTDIAEYNSFIQDRAAAGHADIQVYGFAFKVVGSTADTDARDNTATRYTGDDTAATDDDSDLGVPIYWLGGNKVADEYRDFYDEDWDDEANRNDESGSGFVFVDFPFTGSDHDGTEAFAGGNSTALGASPVRVGRPNSSTSGRGPLSSSTTLFNSVVSQFYGLSPVFRVEGQTTTITVPVETTPVPTTWSLVPSGLVDGDSFRLLFIGTNGRDASSSDIAVYNTFLQNQVETNGHADIRAHSATFRMLGSTEDVDARDNTGTTGTGVPIYWLNGAKVADNYADFYDGDWDQETMGARETGVSVSIGTVWKIWTGSAQDGTEAMNAGGTESRALGNSGNHWVMQGSPNGSDSAHGPIASDTASKVNIRGLYGLSGVFTVDASLDAVNNPPVFSADTDIRTVPENSPTGTSVGDPVTATDADAGDAVTYAITGGADQALFRIDPTSGVLTLATVLDHENPRDADTNNVYLVTVTATGGTGNRALTTDQAITVTVTDVDEPPSAPAAPSVSAVVDSTTSLLVSWTAPDNSGKPDIESYDLQYRQGTSSWTDGPQDVTVPEAIISGLAAGTEYEVRVRATNDEGDSMWSASGTGSTNASAGLCLLPAGRLWSACLTAGEIHSAGRYGYESTTSIGTLVPDGFDIGATTYTVTHLFDNDGVAGSTYVAIIFSPILPEDDAGSLTLHLADDTSLALGDATYTTGTTGTGWSRHQWSRAAAQGWSEGQKIVVGITQDSTPPATNAAPEFTSAATFTADENQMAVGTVIATDADAGDTVSYAVTGGADQAHFEIDSDSGVLTFAAAPDHENPADDDTNNVYQVTVTATGGTGARAMTATQDISVTVNDVDETPAVASVDVTSTPSATADTYGLDETIEVTVTFDQAVTVNTSGGTPSIEFEAGGNQAEHLKLATYADGSGTTTLRFDYVVQSGDMDDNGIWLKGDKLELNGGTIQGDDDDVAANLDYSSLGRQDDHKVDGSLTTAAGCGTLPTGRLWSACLTVGSFTSSGVTFFGWNDGGSYTGSSLTDEDFDYGAGTYNLSFIGVVGGKLSISFNDTGAGDIAAQATRDKLTLHVGDTEMFNFGDGDLDITSTGVEWTSTGLTWADGDTVALSISVPVETTPVPTTWSLVPSGLGDGASFRLLFIGTSNRDASDSDIAVYNTFIQNLVDTNGHDDIKAHSATFRMLGSTEDVDARDNTGTTGTGVPIYWLNGAKVADDYADLYDGDWDEEATGARETGASVSILTDWKIWTGSAQDGTEAFHSNNTSRALGNAGNQWVMQGSPNGSDSAHGPIASNTANRNTDRGLYGLSGVFTVDASLTPPATNVAPITGDFDLHADNGDPTGIWGNDETIWISEDAGLPSTSDKLFAYKRSDGARDTGKDFDGLNDAGNNDPAGIWSDGVTMFVVDGGDRKVYAYKMVDDPDTLNVDEFGTRDTSLEFNLHSSNNNPLGIWGNDDTIWISQNAAPAIQDKLFAYKRSDGARDTGKDFDGLNDAGNNYPTGIWSDGTSMFVADLIDDKVYAYALSGGSRHSSRDITLGAENGSPGGLWGDPAAGVLGTLWVVDQGDDKLYAYDLYHSATGAPTIDGTPVVGETLTADASGIEDLDGIPDDVEFSYQWIRVDGGSDADIAGANESAYTLVAADVGKQIKVRVGFTDSPGNDESVSSEATEAVTVAVPITGDFDLDADNGDPTGIWGNDETIWISEDAGLPSTSDKLFAYKRSNGHRDSGKDFDGLSAAGNNDPAGIWSDGVTMFVVDGGDRKVYAYKMVDDPDTLNVDEFGTRDTSLEFNLHSSNNNPLGIWGNDDTIWISQNATPAIQDKLFAYKRSDGARDSGKDFDGLNDAGNNYPTGIWSDGTSMFVADLIDDKVYAYALSGGSRHSGRDITLDADNGSPGGLWGDPAAGALGTLWVVDQGDDKLYAYDLVGVNRAPTFQQENTTREVEENSPAGTAVGDPVTATDADDDTLTYTLEGPDAASFQIVSTSGQIQTKSGITYDYETKEEYAVTVRADDGKGGTDTIAVAIDLLDVDETAPPPGVSSVDVTSTPAATADTYGWNETIEVTVTFDQAVRVTGTPRILLRIGGGQPQHRMWADYAGGTGTTALRFTYVVQAGDMDDDGIYIEANELVLTGGTIQSADGTDAVLDYARLGTQSGHKVDGSLTTIVPGTPTGLSATASGQTVVNLSWTAPDGPVTGYRIEYRPEGGSWTDVEADTGSPATTYRHQELDPGTTYEYRVSAINPAGTGTASNTASATTDEQGSPVFTSGAAFSVEENETAVGTVTAADPDPEDTVRYAITGGDDRADFQIDPASGALTFITSPDYESPADADENNVYQVTVTATGGEGARALTANQAITVTVTGVNEPPGKPVGPWASWLVDNPGTLSVRWYAPHWGDESESFGKPPITSYQVRYQKGDIDDWGKWEKWEEWTYWPDAQGIPAVEAAANSDQTEFSVYIDGLEPGATYQLQVRAVNDDGAGVWSNRGSNRKPTGPVAEVDVNGDGIVDADPVITLPVGGAATYRVRPGRCEGYKSLNAQALRGTTENAPQHIPVDVSPADVYMTCAGEDDPGEWQEITLTGPSDELLSTSFEASVLHTVMYQQRSHESWTFLMSWGHLVTAEVPAPETMAPVGSLTVTAEEGRDRPHVTWNAVSGAPYYQVQWRWGPDEEWGPFQSQGGATYTRQKETEETAYTIPISGTVPTVNDVKRTQDVMVRVRPFDYDSLAVGPWREVTLPGRAVRPPEIIGTARVGQTLTADTSPITRESAALANAAFSYQWLRTGGADGYHDIPGATGSTYTLTPYDEVRRIKVRVTFTNEEGEEETQTSSVTAKVAPADADESEVALPASAAVLAGFSLVDAGASPQTLLAQPMDGASVELANPDGGSYAIRADLNEGHTAGSVALELTGRKSASTTEGVMPYSLYGDDGAGALRGEALPAGSYVLTMTAYEGSGGGGAVLHTLEVSFTVTAAAEEPGTGQEDEEEENTAPLTARFLHEGPLGYHSGAGTTLTVRLSFSEAVSITPEALEQALMATNATVEAVSRVDGRSDLWEVRLTPHSDATVTLLLPLAADCDAAGAVCTGDGRAPAHAIGTAIPGPLPNSQATGAPTIDGVAEVGQVLSADVTGIDDDNAAFSYQWLRSDGDAYTEIEDATGSTYTLVAADQGKTIKVKVSFTDDEGNPETLTSDPTGEVEAAETVPGRPQDLEGEASAQGIALTWNAPVDSTVTSYVIYRAVLDQGQLHGKPMTKHATIDATGAEMAYFDADAEAGVEYRYRVAAVNSAGEGKKSTWINIFAEDS